MHESQTRDDMETKKAKKSHRIKVAFQPFSEAYQQEDTTNTEQHLSPELN